MWNRGLACKLLRLIPDRHLVRMIMELVQNRSFTLTTGNGKQSRLRRLKNSVPQGSVLAPLLFNIDVSDLPSTSFSKFAYADNLALVHIAGDWRTLEKTLSQDMATLQMYLQKMEIEAQRNKNSVVCIPSYQQGSKTWAFGGVEWQANSHSLILQSILAKHWIDLSRTGDTWSHFARNSASELY